MDLDPVLAHIDADLPNALDRLLDLLRIQSISTDPAFAKECDKAADWLVDDLKTMGVVASKRKTPKHPMVVGHAEGDGTHVMFYGHYDVQPVDPLELWNSDPFAPAVEDTPKQKI